ncbi:MAG: PAS domain-containing protein [Candidatus Cloacimonadales bacterium]
MKNDEQNAKIVADLLKFSKGMIAGKPGKELIEKYQSSLEKITPALMIEMEKKQLEGGISPAKIKQHIEKVMNVIYPYLQKYEWEKPEKGHPLYYYMQENRELEKILQDLKLALAQRDFEQTQELLAALCQMENHYLRKENILFPYLERIWENHQPLQVMWSLQDDIRSKWKLLQKLAKKDKQFSEKFMKEIGQLFFLMYGMISKEELVIFPQAMETVQAEETWQKMQKQAADLGYSYITAPQTQTSSTKPAQSKLSQLFWQVESGELSQEQLDILLNHLPLDLTFVDENDRVRYFSRPQERFFPRSPAIIGRHVHNCHPPESVHIVEKIIAEFRAGTKDEAKFWFQMRGKFLLIRYFAMRDEKGKYRGVLEVGQDISEIRQLSGEQRLLDWE